MAKKATKKATKKSAKKTSLVTRKNYTADGFYRGSDFIPWDSKAGLEKRKFRNSYEFMNGIPAHNSTRHGRDVDDHFYALPAGYKVSKRTGNWYNEYRQNRTDSHQEHHSAYNNNMSAKRKDQTYKHVYIGEERLVGDDKKLKAVRFTIGYTDYLNNPTHTLKRAVQRYKNNEWGVIPNQDSMNKYGVPRLGLGHEKAKYGKNKYKPSSKLRVTKSDVFEYADPFTIPVKYTKKATPKKITAKKTTAKKATPKKTAKKTSSKGTKQTKLY